MKMTHQIMMLSLIAGLHLNVPAQEVPEGTGMDGDHFSLEGALELFKKSKSPEAFEELLNTKDQNVNNLDLNQDGEVDYIRIVDHGGEDVHAIVLTIAVSESENQDIAVIEIERQGDEYAILQIIGDPDVFGSEIILEPFEEEVSGNGKGYDGDDSGYAHIVVNVWTWPCVGFIYAPGYRSWVSPWRWRHYPNWWRPWRPLVWSAWHVRVAPYRAHRYHIVSSHRVTKAHAVYVPRRTHSVVVKTRTTTTLHTRKGTIKKTTTKTKVKGAPRNKGRRK